MIKAKRDARIAELRTELDKGWHVCSQAWFDKEKRLTKELRSLLDEKMMVEPPQP